MDWSDVAETVGKIAPAVGASLAGPGGRAVGGLVARALGVAPRPEAVAAAVQEDPHATIALRKIEADLEQALIQGRSQVLAAEVQGESWLQRSWRPLVMLWFSGLVGAHWLGVTPDNLDPAAVTGLLDIVQVGLGGYVIGRSAEKITRSVTGSGVFDNLKAKVKR